MSVPSVRPADPGGSSSPPATEAYRVRPGDTLTSIAAAHGVSLGALEKANPQILHPDLIHPGDAVHIPSSGGPGGGAAPQTYTVKAGDTLSGIGARYGVDWRVLAQVNHISDPNLIRPNQRLTIAGAASGSNAAPSGGPTGSQAPAATGGAPQLGSGSRAEQAVRYFESQGWSHAQAAGIAANLQTESGFNPGAVGDGGSAYGIGQWHPDRQAAFQQMTGHSIRGSSYADQLRFVQYELTHGESGAAARLRSASTASEAGAAVSRYYERPADVSGEASRRGALAQRIAGETH